MLSANADNLRALVGTTRYDLVLVGRAESAVVGYTEYALDMQNLQKMHGLDFTNAWKYRGIQMQSQTWMINDHGVSLSSVYGEDGEDDEDLPA